MLEREEAGEEGGVSLQGFLVLRGQPTGFLQALSICVPGEMLTVKNAAVM